MSTIVIMPGGFHPFHAGHADLYQQAKKAFPGADIYVAATNDQSERPFPFALKEKLAKLAGVESGHFVQVKSPFQAKEITQHYNPEQDVLIFVRSEKDRNESPKPGGTKKDGSPAYFQPYTGKDMQPFSQHAYIDYLKTVEFGPGITSATQIRNAWPTLNDKRKTALVMSLYPAAQKNLKLAKNIVGMFDQVMGEPQGVAEGSEKQLTIQQLATISDEALDKAYGYGRSIPGNSFGWQANLMSAAYAKKMIDAGVTDIEKISDAIHKGWNVTAQKFVQDPDQFGDTEKLRQAGKLEAKLQQRAKLMKINYAQLDNNEQEKDRVVARALLQALTGQQGVAEGFNGGDIELSHSMSPDILYVHVTSDGSDVGGARFKKIHGVWTGDIVHVYPQFRRQGVATKIYDYAEELVGKINPSKTLKPKGKKFWSSRDKQGVAEGKITLSTDPNWYGATVDNYQASGPVVNIPANQLVGFEPDDKMNQPKSKVNVEKIVAGLKQGAKLPPLLVRKYKNGYQVLDGHHRFWAYKLLGVKSIPAQIVPDSDIEEISKQGVGEGKVINTYLWHGSRQKIPMLEPRQSVDTGGAAGSNQNAIYATSDPKVAIAMGLTTPGSDTGMFPNDPQMVLFSGKIRKGENVYLHKVPMNGPNGKPQFVQGGNSREFHSVPGVKVIKPTEIKAVPVDKYLNLIRQATPQDLELRKKYMKQGVAEARSNPERNRRSGSGKYDLINYAEDNITDKDNWAVSMTVEPKLGINPQAAVSEDTPKGIYFYPLRYFMQMADRDESLPWGDNFPYIQLFQYDRSGEMTQQTKVDPAKLKQALLQYCPEEVIQQAIDEPEYDGTPYWFIYDCLSRLGNSDETNIVRWNKVLRDLGFTSVFDDGAGWIAYNEPTQGVVLDPRIIKQHKMFSNRNPTLQNRRYDIQGLADAIGWSSYFQRESQLQRIYNHPDEKKVMLDVAKSMLKPFLGKSSEEAEEMGYDQAVKAAADKVIEILKNTKNVDEGFGLPMPGTYEQEHGTRTPSRKQHITAMTYENDMSKISDYIDEK